MYEYIIYYYAWLMRHGPCNELTLKILSGVVVEDTLMSFSLQPLQDVNFMLLRIFLTVLRDLNIIIIIIVLSLTHIVHRAGNYCEKNDNRF